MKVRPAELRDLDRLKAMFIALCDHLKACDQWLLNSDRRELENGVVGFLLRKMFPPEGEESVIFVAADDQDRPTGFIIGWIVCFPQFFQHQRVADVQFMYPLSFAQSPQLAFAFETWGRSRGATATSNCATPGNTASIKVMERDGRKLAYYQFFKPLEKIPYE